MKKFLEKFLDYVFNRRKYNRDKNVAAFIEGHATVFAYHSGVSEEYEEFHKKYVLTEEEIDQMLSSVVVKGCWFFRRECRVTPGNLMYFITPPMSLLMQKQPNVKPEHIDMLLDRKSIDTAIMVFDSYPNLTSEQIEYGLNHENEIVKELAVNHPNCPEAKKVWYHLKYGV